MYNIIIILAMCVLITSLRFVWCSVACVVRMACGTEHGWHVVLSMSIRHIMGYTSVAMC